MNLQPIESLPLAEGAIDGVSLVGWDGSKTVRVNANELGGGNGMPEDGEPHQQLVTDGEGKTVWEEKTHYKTAFLSYKTDPNTDPTDGTVWDAGCNSIDSNLKAAAYAIANELGYGKYEGRYDKFVFYLDRVRYEFAAKIPLNFSRDDGYPFDGSVMQTGAMVNGEGFLFLLRYYDGQEHSVQLELANPVTQTLSPEYIVGSNLIESDNGKVLGAVDGKIKLVEVVDAVARENIETLGETVSTNGETVAELKQKSDQLSENIDKLSEEIAALKGGSEGDYSEETITPDIQGYLLMTGLFNDATTKARRTDYISLEGCTRIKAQYRLATNGCAVAFFDENKTFMPDVSVAGVGLDADTITEIAPPAGATYVMLSHYLGSDLNYVGFITLTIGGGGAEKTVSVEPQTGYVKYDTGLLASDTGGWNTGYVETAGFEKAEYYGRMNSGGAVLAFYDANKLYLQRASVAGSPSGIEWVAGTVDIPSDAAYAMVSSYGTGSGNNNGGAAYLRLFSEGGGGIAGLEADIADLTGKVNPLKGKRFAVLGDSISSVNYTLPVWWQLIAEKYGCEFVNYGVSGSRIAVTSEETGKSFTERYVAMDDTVDGVVVVGGTNDAWYTPIGAFNSADNTTLNGALNEMLPGLLNKYPGKPVLFFAPIQREDYTESDYPVTVVDLKSLDVTQAIGRNRVNLAIMVKCRQYGVPCVDLYSACGINGNDTNSVYFRTDDNLHPSALGMHRIAGVVAAEMFKHFMFVD